MSIKIPSSELIQLLHDLEDLETTNIEDLVLNAAIKAGFVTSEDSTTNLYRRAWICEVTKTANDAYRLEDVAIGEHLEETIYTVKALLKAREKKVCDILALLSKKILYSTSPYLN